LAGDWGGAEKALRRWRPKTQRRVDGHQPAYQELAERLGISGPTVNTYIRRMYEKLHVRSRAQAVAKFAHLA
jgi:DNA-directed RNA polymerase specialized sigma24 family protein